MSETTELDRTRRYLRPVQVTTVSGDPDGVHLSVYEWLPRFEAWATGLALCGASADQGALPEGTVVTCASCLEYKPKYERYLAPGYQPGDDDPELLRAKLARIRAEVSSLCDCCLNNRERMGRIRRELGLDTEGYFRKDGEEL